MKTTVVANPAAASGKVRRAWKTFETAILEGLGSCEVKMTSMTDSADRCVAQAIENGARRIVVVGGDGTLGQAVNGLPWNNTGDFPQFVYIPAGTGSDFARSAGLRNLSVAQMIETGQTRPIDIGRVESTGPGDAPIVRYFINEASIGVSALVVEKVNQSTKKLGGRISFMLGTLKGLSGWRGRNVRLRIDNEFDQVIPITSLAVANGRYFGGGMKVAPEALLDDSLLDIVIIKDAGISTFLRHGVKLYAGKHLGLPIVSSMQGSKIQIGPAEDTGSPIPLETDGESCGHLPVEIEILPKALNLTAPWSKSEAVGFFDQFTS